MPKMSLFPLCIPCIQGTRGQPHRVYSIYLPTWHPLSLNSLTAMESMGYNHPCTPLDGAVWAAGNTGTDYYTEPLRGCKLTASGTNLRASSCPTLPVPCQSSLPDAGKQVHLWSSSGRMLFQCSRKGLALLCLGLRLCVCVGWGVAAM